MACDFPGCEKTTARMGRPHLHRFCDVDECPKPHYSRGFCTLHYQKHRKYGDPLATFNRQRRVAKTAPQKLACEIAGCKKQSDRMGLCTAHYTRKLRGTLYCGMPWCDEVAESRSLCASHKKRIDSWDIWGRSQPAPRRNRRASRVKQKSPRNNSIVVPALKATTKVTPKEPQLVRQLPAAPLQELIRSKAKRISADTEKGGNAAQVTTNSVMRVLNMNGTAFKKLMNAETVKWDTADRCCGRLGVHPSEVWGLEWDALEEEVVDLEHEEAA